jgi:hypothetical protein
MEIAAAGGIPIHVSMARDGSEVAKAEAAGALRYLAHDTLENTGRSHGFQRC